MTLFHYTPTTGYAGIVQSGGVLQPSNPWTTMDSAFGVGTYFTDVGPDFCRSYIAYVCWTKPALDRVACYLKYEIDATIVTACKRPNVFMVQVWDIARIRLLAHGNNPTCVGKHHPACTNYAKYFSSGA